MLLAVLLLGGALLARELNRGWVPHDEGALGQSAERVLAGQVPHRDFDEIYTGLLSYLNAAAFRLGGIRASTLRLPLFGFALLWLATLYRMAIRFAPPAGAGLVALACFVYSVPNYRAAVPSWYILFFATFGAFALMRWHEDPRRRWLVLAGAAGGIAFLFKLSGVFCIAGGGLALLATSRRSIPEIGATKSLRWFQLAFTAAMATIGLGLAVVVARVGNREVVRLVVPVALIMAAIIASEWRMGRGAASGRLRELFAALGPYLLGVGIPLACLLLAYAVAGGVSDLILGVFVTPFRLLSSAFMRPPAWGAILWVVPIGWALWPQRVRRDALLTTAITITWFGVLIIGSAREPVFYQAGWLASWGVPVLVAIAGAALWLKVPADDAERRTHAHAITLCAMAVCCLFVEFPFAAPIYTLYALPLSLLALAATVCAWNRTPKVNQVAVALFFLLFGYFRLVPGTLNSLGQRFAANTEDARSALPRADLRIPPDEAAQYDELITFVQQTATGRVLWAGPDAPEVYFLSGRPNRTRTLFQFLDRSPETTRSLAWQPRSVNASLVVLKLRPEFSPAPTMALITELRAAYPKEREFSEFLVLWR